MIDSIETIVEMKNYTNNLGVNSYDWFFMDLENNYLSKLGGTKRNASILKDYSKEVRDYVIQQLFYINSNAARELMSELEVTELVVSKENYKHIIKD